MTATTETVTCIYCAEPASHADFLGHDCCDDCDTQRNIAAALVAYEQQARMNRPDWAAFVTGAQAEPWEITCEVADVYQDLHGETCPDMDALQDASDAWLEALTA